jgi:hypothetical protein
MFDKFRRALARRISPGIIPDDDAEEDDLFLSYVPAALSGEVVSQPSGERDFYILSINRSDGEIAYAEIRPRGLVIFSDPTQLFPVTDASREKLKLLMRIVTVERACGADEPVDIASLRVIRVRANIEDVTAEIQGLDEEDAKEHQKLAALAKLTDTEARLLGLADEKALFKLTQRPEAHVSDDLKEIEGEAIQLRTLEALFR